MWLTGTWIHFTGGVRVVPTGEISTGVGTCPQGTTVTAWRPFTLISTVQERLEVRVLPVTVCGIFEIFAHLSIFVEEPPACCVCTTSCWPGYHPWFTHITRVHITLDFVVGAIYKLDLTASTRIDKTSDIRTTMTRFILTLIATHHGLRVVGTPQIWFLAPSVVTRTIGVP